MPKITVTVDLDLMKLNKVDESEFYGEYGRATRGDEPRSWAKSFMAAVGYAHGATTRMTQQGEQLVRDARIARISKEITDNAPSEEEMARVYAGFEENAERLKQRRAEHERREREGIPHPPVRLMMYGRDITPAVADS